MPSFSFLTSFLLLILTLFFFFCLFNLPCHPLHRSLLSFMHVPPLLSHHPSFCSSSLLPAHFSSYFRHFNPNNNLSFCLSFIFVAPSSRPCVRSFISHSSFSPLTFAYQLISLLFDTSWDCVCAEGDHVMLVLSQNLKYVMFLNVILTVQR